MTCSPSRPRLYVETSVKRFTTNTKRRDRDVQKRFRAMMLRKLRPGHVAASIVFVLIPTLLITPRTVMAAVTSIGSVTSLTASNDPTSGNTMYFFSVSNGGTAEVTPWAPDVVRVHYHYTGLFSKEEPMIAKPFSNWVAVATSIADQGTNYLIQT